MTNQDNMVFPVNGFKEEKEQKMPIPDSHSAVNRTPIEALASCTDMSDYITVFEQFILIEDLHIK